MTRECVVAHSRQIVCKKEKKKQPKPTKHPNGLRTWHAIMFTWKSSLLSKMATFCLVAMGVSMATILTEMSSAGWRVAPQPSVLQPCWLWSYNTTPAEAFSISDDLYCHGLSQLPMKDYSMWPLLKEEFLLTIYKGVILIICAAGMA